jgi:hypothetical protein
MTTYWITFRIADQTISGRDWSARYQALMDTIDQNSTKWWTEPTSFVAFESASAIDALAREFKAAIAPSHDLFLMREIDTKSARICGLNNNATIYEFMDYLKAV